MSSNTLPNSIVLKDWLSPQYVKDFEDGVLYKRWCHETPFKYAVLPDLFLSPIIQSITQYCRTIPVSRAHTQGIPPQTKWYWGAFGYLEVVRFIYSKSFQSFLSTLLGECLRMKATLVPSITYFNQVAEEFQFIRTMVALWMLFHYYNCLNNMNQAMEGNSSFIEKNGEN